MSICGKLQGTLLVKTGIGEKKGTYTFCGNV